MDDDNDSNAKPGRAGDAVAAGVALGSPLDPAAAAYLEEQTRLARLQAENLIEQNAFELSHLRWRRFNDQMKGALQIMAVTLGLAVVGGLVMAVWNASQADGIVVDSFSVPATMADGGVTGDVVADDITSRIATIHNVVNTNSLDDPKAVQKSGGADIRVEIPQTGISLAQAWHYLKLWFGHERHLSGNLRDLGGGKIALNVLLDGAEAFAAEGRAADLSKIEQQAAEYVYGTADPVNIAVYLGARERYPEALAAAARAVHRVRNPGELTDAYSFWAYETRWITGDMALAATLARLGRAVDPRHATPHLELLRNAIALGHDEEALAVARVIAALRERDQPPSQRASFAFIRQTAQVFRDAEAGDFQRALVDTCDVCAPAENAARGAEAAALLHHVARAQALLADAVANQAALAGDPVKAQYGRSAVARARYALDVARGDWHAAAVDAQVAGAGYRAPIDVCLGFKPVCQKAQAMPMIALALARAGDVDDARAAAAATPLDCYDCLRARGEIEALARDWFGAAAWFKRAIAVAPSPAFAYADWGAMLLHKGDFDAAIAKFDLAHQKGPHFADPLELWGEALIVTNRSDLAVLKFTEAARHAPNWGRLHLKWGEALWWLGRKDDAKKQFAIARALFMTPAERAQLADISHV